MSARTFFALGTASQVPTRDRNHNGYFLRWDAEGFLFDPGEGTQRQMTFAELSATSITKIFITHFHGDHCLGLAGIVQRLSLDRVPQTVEIYYPASGEKYLENLLNASIYHNVAKVERKPVSNAGVIFEGADYTIETARLDHPVECWGYRVAERDSVTMLPGVLDELGIRGADIGRIKATGEITIGDRTIGLADVSVPRKGQTFAFVMDTRVCENAVALARDADMLVCESTYLESEAEDAAANGHLTARQAAGIAREANARTLVLTHFSQRYPNTRAFVGEAKTIHADTVAVRDGDSVDFPKRS